MSKQTLCSFQSSIYSLWKWKCIWSNEIQKNTNKRVRRRNILNNENHSLCWQFTGGKKTRMWTKQEQSRVWSGTTPVDHMLKLLIHPVVCPHLHRELCQALISVSVLLDRYRTRGSVLVFAEVRCFLRSAAWPLAVAVKKPLREWEAWLPVPCLLINDLLLELATNLERER